MKIVKIEKRKSTVPHRDITVEKNHNFFANGVLTHNCNLPAKNVVITGVHRGMNDIEVLDILQMAGRAGRMGYHPKGYVYLVIQERIRAMWEYKINNQEPIMSCLVRNDILAFHIMSEISSGSITELEHVYKWYHRSLASTQSIEFSNETLTTVVNDLKSMQMVKPETTLKETGLGKVSALLYFSPYDIWDWYNNFSYIIKTKQNSNLLKAWAIGDIESKRMPFIPKQLAEDEAMLKKMLFSEGVTRSQVAAVGQILGVYHCLEGTESNNAYLSSMTRVAAMALDRSITALKMMDTFYTRWDYEWDDLHKSAMYGVSKELFHLVSIPGVGKTRAEKLFNNGFKTIKSIVDSPLEKLARLVGAGTAKAIKEYCSTSKDLQNVSAKDKVSESIKTKMGEKTYVRRRKNLD